MVASDLPTINRLERECFPNPWPASSFRDILNAENHFNIVIADPQDDPIAYLCAAFVADEVQIHNIAVAKEYRRNSLGRRLLEAAETEGRARGAFGSVLDVRSTNTAALALYGRFGYRRVGRRRGYYERPAGDALILFKPLVGKGERSDGVVS
jgi:ribosomal-protein-alanine N-acetyltransferase